MSLSPAKGLHHIVLISFKPETPEALRQDILHRYQSLGTLCGGETAGILAWTVETNLDTRKEVHLVEYALLRDTGALDALKAHPAHQAIVEDLKAIADWQVADFVA